MRLAGLGAVNDATVLEPGVQVSFSVEASPACQGVTAQDVRDTLNNWNSQMLQLNRVESRAGNWMPFYTNFFDVQASVRKQIAAGLLRAQIIASLDAMTGCPTGGVSLSSNALNVTGVGGTHDPGEIPVPNSQGGIPWSTTAVVLGVAGLAALAIVKFK